MPETIWQQAIEACADPERARRFLDSLWEAKGSQLEAWSHEAARRLTALLGGSQALSEQLIQNPGWLETALLPEALDHPRKKQGLEQEADQLVEQHESHNEYPKAYDALRAFKQKEMVRIGTRDLAKLGSTVEIMTEISDLADVCLARFFGLCYRQMTRRFGQPYHQDADGEWQPTSCCLLGLGKLGGQELNYSSDIDLMFLYEDEGQLFQKSAYSDSKAVPGMANHRFFNRFVDALVNELSRRTAAGWLFRVDLRLRPEGNTGPLARSLGSSENYYAQWGQTWERMMLIKARSVGGDQSLAGEFLETIQPFRFPRTISERILDEVAHMKGRIEREVVKADEIDRNVKLGRGGIREIEFVVQSLQVLRGGRIPFVQGHQTLSVLEKLKQYELLPPDDVRQLREAYLFLRDLEHRLQMEENLQTHTLPATQGPRVRLARLLGFESLDAFDQRLYEHTSAVRAVYDGILQSHKPEPKATLPNDFDESREQWKSILQQHSFRDVDYALGLIRELVEGPGYIHISARTSSLAFRLIPRLLAKCPRQDLSAEEQPTPMLSDPDRVLARIASFVSAYGARTMLFETWASNPSLFDLLLQLFDASEFLAAMAIREPDLVDDLEQSGHLRRRKTSKEILTDLEYGLGDEDQEVWMRRYHRTEFMRLGLRDILGLTSYEENLGELSALADACVQYALEVVQRRHGLQEPPFAIIGFGKLGGQELNYGSDLDILFIAGRTAPDVRSLSPLAREVMELLSNKTEEGSVFDTDARLRPDGEAGLVVNTLDAYESYYSRRAQLWEIQALTRMRPIAGDDAVSREFQQTAAELTDFSRLNNPPAAYREDWRREIHRMRMRIEKERTPAGSEALAIKTGAGGLVDAEFIGQALCLAYGWHEPNSIKMLERALDAGALTETSGRRLLESYRQLRRFEGTLRRWSFQGETVLPQNPAPLYRVAVRCGYLDADSFLDSVKEHREVIRSVYREVFPF